jgi:hypothetical protein
MTRRGMDESKLTEEMLAWDTPQKIEYVACCSLSMADLRLECLRIATALLPEEQDSTTIVDLLHDAGTLLYYVLNGSPPPDDDAPPPVSYGGLCDA